ncbi:hypothetical protein HMPREF9004_1783 [Schaalia cardiffensis F0333]|uniref:Uncharacterized protein n=1 Tax=Schaalia cardiffensis F0333 TaxID=888050 RepID=N6X8J1_9ACTO|nr:hypothetical protein HMPREF9004_1783 [Schaalia cardiffensis F0333]
MATSRTRQDPLKTSCSGLTCQDLLALRIGLRSPTLEPHRHEWRKL